MTLEWKIKRAALLTSLKYILRNSKKSSERAARNIIEICSNISKVDLSEEKKSKLYIELNSLIKVADEDKIMELVESYFAS